MPPRSYASQGRRTRIPSSNRDQENSPLKRFSSIIYERQEAKRWDTTVMDYKMYNSDGLTAAEGIFKVRPDVPIVMFTLYKTNDLEYAAQLKGIRCVVGKEEGVQSLLRAIQA